MKSVFLFPFLIAYAVMSTANANEGHGHAHDHAEHNHEAAVSHDHSDHADHDHAHDHDAEKSPASTTPTMPDSIVALDEQGVNNLRLELVDVKKADFAQTIFALGRIEVFPGKLTVVSSRIAGRAISVAVKPDQRVQAGEPLAVIESRQPGEPPPHITLTAPASGILAAVDVAPGKPVSPDDSLMTIVDLSEVHAIARVPEHFAGQLNKGIKANIRVPGYPEKTFSATLEHMGVRVDSQTGTLEAAFHVPNGDTLLRPGMRAEFSIVTQIKKDVLSVPRESVQGDAANRHVYIAARGLKNSFARKQVTLGEQNDTRMEITHGLEEGDRVVTRGAYALGFAGQGAVSLKVALDAMHGHAHAEDGAELPEKSTAPTTATNDAHVDDDHDDHDHPTEADTVGSAPTWFFAALSAMLAVLLALSLFFRKNSSAA